MNSLKKRAQQGFTIVELLIVIVVIGILAGLVITTYSGIQQNARNKERTTDLKALEGQLEAFYSEKGRYPTTAELGTTPANVDTFIPANMKGLKKEALRDPKAPVGNYALATAPTVNQYSYVAQASGGGICDNAGTDCGQFTLTAKQEGGGSDIVVQSAN